MMSYRSSSSSSTMVLTSMCLVVMIVIAMGYVLIKIDQIIERRVVALETQVKELTFELDVLRVEHQGEMHASPEYWVDACYEDLPDLRLRPSGGTVREALRATRSP